jgi:3',5'-cyclic AMP phosphodiesterase CpdA
MKIVAHLSDLHFGSLDPSLVEAMAVEVRAAEPSIVIVSGDLTQRARKQEFIQARTFLDTLPSPRLVVPGNHDVPLFDLYARLFTPLSRYKRYISTDTDPFYADGELAIAGINTSRSLTFKGGRINSEQLTRVMRSLADLPEDTTRIVVTHHPFEGVSAADNEDVVGRARMAMTGFSRSRVDLILSGHLHLNRVGSSASQYAIEGYSALLVQAGTAISSRRRDSPNSFNLIRIDWPSIEIECRAWDPNSMKFFSSARQIFQFGSGGWAQLYSAVDPMVTQ